jgi:hypothetical protein
LPANTALTQRTAEITAQIHAMACLPPAPEDAGVVVAEAAGPVQP